VVERIARATVALLGVGSAVFMLWFALDELASGEPWFGLLAAACAPVLVGAGLMLPELVAAPDSAARTRVIAHPVPWACQAAFVWLVVIAGGAYLAGTPGALVGAAIGAVVTWQGLETRRVLEATASQSANEQSADGEPPTRGQWAQLIVKLVLLWLAFVVVAAGAGYAVFGLEGAVAGGLLMLVGLFVLYAVSFYRWKRKTQRRG
jgi:hypothetical protein